MEWINTIIAQLLKKFRASSPVAYAIIAAVLLIVSYAVSVFLENGLLGEGITKVLVWIQPVLIGVLTLLNAGGDDGES